MSEIYRSGRALSLAATHPTTPAINTPCRVGQLTGVARTDERADLTTSIDFGPAVYGLKVKGVNDDGNSAVAIGDALYYVDADIDDGTGFLSKKVSGYFFGYALQAVNAGATSTGKRVLILPAPGGSAAEVPAGEIAPASLGLLVVADVGNLAAGDLVYIKSYNAALGAFIAGKADADVANARAQYVTTAAIVAGATGRVVKARTITGVETGGSTVGNPVYLSAATAGAWTLTPPSGADDVIQIVGRVTIVGASPAGAIALNLSDLGDGSIGTNELQALAVTAAKIASSAVETAKINNDAVDKDKIAADVAGSGLGQNVDGSLEVKVDGATLEINADTLRVKDAGITAAKLDPGVIVAATGLYGNDLGQPDLSDDDWWVTDAAMKATAYTIANAALPADNPPRSVKVTLTTVTAAPADNDTLGSVVIDGTDVNNAVISETIALVANSSVVSTKAFKTVTAVNTAGWIIDGAAGIADRIKVGFDVLLGLAQVHAAASEVFLTTFDGAFVNPDGVTVDPAVVSLNTVDLSSQVYNGAKTAKAVLAAV